ncbi:MAG: hypothetical protein ACLGIN_18595 [Candidatus Sericytochromatia bacterium]
MIVLVLLWMVVMVVPGLYVPNAIAFEPVPLPISALAFWRIRRWYLGSAWASKSPAPPASAR